jgi:hypothetical protein
VQCANPHLLEPTPGKTGNFLGLNRFRHRKLSVHVRLVPQPTCVQQTTLPRKTGDGEEQILQPAGQATATPLLKLLTLEHSV